MNSILTIKTSTLILALAGAAVVSSMITYSVIRVTTPDAVCLPVSTEAVPEAAQPKPYKKTRKIPYNDGERF